MTRILVDLLSYTGKKGGTETYTRNLYAAVGDQRRDWEFVGLASQEAAATDLSWFPGRIIASGISGENRIEWAKGELFAVARVADSQQADLIHGPASFAPLRSSVPHVVTMHDMFYFTNPEMIGNRLYVLPVRWMERNAVHRAAQVITDSEASAVAIRRILRPSPTRLTVIPLAGPPISSPHPRSPSAPPMILGTGNRLPHKNWETVVAALARMRPGDRPTFVLTGGQDPDPLQEVVDRSGMSPWVDLRGWVTSEEMAHLRSSATVQVISSFLEGFSLPVLEAMAAGLPVVLSDIPVHREVAGDAAVYFPPHDPAVLADVLTALTVDRKRLAALTSAGRDRAAEFSWDEVAARTLDVFGRALAESERSRR